MTSAAFGIGFLVMPMASAQENEAGFDKELGKLFCDGLNCRVSHLFQSP